MLAIRDTGMRQRAASTPDFILSNASVSPAWNVAVVVGTLTPINAPTGAYFVLVSEDAGLAVVNG